MHNSPMASESELWAALGPRIINAPDDDNVRLRFAEALESSEGTERELNLIRARFIRVQLKLHTIQPDHSEWFRLSTEALSLELNHEREWTPAWFRDVGIREAQFHRGFVECITVSAPTLLQHQQSIFANAPIRHLDIVELPKGKLQDMLDNLAPSKNSLGRLISLRLDGQEIDDNDIEILIRAPWTKLRWMSLANNEITKSGAQTLTDDHLTELQFLDLHGNPFDPTAELNFDQGVVIEKRQQFWKEKLPSLLRFQPEVISGQVIYPNRFQIGFRSPR